MKVYILEAVDQGKRDARLSRLAKQAKKIKLQKSDYSYKGNVDSSRKHRIDALIRKHKTPGEAKNPNKWLRHDSYHARQSHRFHVAQKKRYGKNESLLNLLEKRSKDRKKISKKTAFLRSLYRD